VNLESFLCFLLEHWARVILSSKRKSDAFMVIKMFFSECTKCEYQNFSKTKDEKRASSNEQRE